MAVASLFFMGGMLTLAYLIFVWSKPVAHADGAHLSKSFAATVLSRKASTNHASHAESEEQMAGDSVEGDAGAAQESEPLNWD